MTLQSQLNSRHGVQGTTCNITMHQWFKVFLVYNILCTKRTVISYEGKLLLREWGEVGGMSISYSELSLANGSTNQCLQHWNWLEAWMDKKNKTRQEDFNNIQRGAIKINKIKK